MIKKMPEKAGGSIAMTMNDNQALTAARNHYQKIVAHSKSLEVCLPTLQLVFFCQKHEIQLKEIEGGLDYSVLLGHILSGYKARLTVEETRRLIIATRRLEKVANCKRHITSLDKFIRIIVGLQKNHKDRESCKGMIQRYREKIDGSDSL